MEIEQRMGLRVRSSYEDVVAWIRSGGGQPVPYPKRTELQLMDSHVYSQLNATMSAQETQRVVNEYRRDGFGLSLYSSYVNSLPRACRGHGTHRPGTMHLSCFAIGPRGGLQ